MWTSYYKCRGGVRTPGFRLNHVKGVFLATKLLDHNNSNNTNNNKSKLGQKK